jgi:hypothetical protein
MARRAPDRRLWLAYSRSSFLFREVDLNALFWLVGADRADHLSIPNDRAISCAAFDATLNGLMGAPTTEEYAFVIFV